MLGFCIKSLYLSHRPATMKNSGPLYFAVIPKPKTDVWYKAQKMGVNRIGDMKKRIVRGSQVELNGKRLTNPHSARKNLVKKLDATDVPRAHVVSVTGHRNEKSFDHYVDSLSTKRSKQLSNIISAKETATSVASVFQAKLFLYKTAMEIPVPFHLHPHLHWLFYPTISSA